MKTIFKRKDFTLCDVPVPDGYPQSQTHAGVAKCNGYVYLTCSPYPAKKCGFWEIQYRRAHRVLTGHYPKPSIDADAYENPLIYKATEPGDAPTKFELLKPAPLMERPPFSTNQVTTFNSDPDLFIEDQNIYVLNRSYYRYKGEDGQIKKHVAISLIKGNTDSDFTLKSIEPFMEADSELISPCIEKLNGRYVGAYLETASALDGSTFDGLFFNQSDTLDGLKELNSYKKIKVDTSKYLPWHISFFAYGNRLYSIVTCVVKGIKGKLYQLLGRFDEELAFLSIYDIPLTDYNSYRAAAYVTDEGEFVLYSTTLQNKVRGSKSVDGRDIIMAKVDFEQLLQKIEDEK